MIILIAFVLLAIFLRPIADEFWTICQLIRSLFASEIDLKKKYGSWAIVTGCTDGIGKAFAFELARRGLNLVLMGRNPSKLEDVAAEVRSGHGVETKIVVADFGRGREIYGEIEAGLEGLDVGILVNNVGIQYSYPMYFGELPESELWDLLNVNVGAATQMTRIVLPGMVEKKRGAVVNLSSGSKLQPLPFMNLYAASKAFLDYFTNGLRHEYRDSDLTIQSLCPFYVTTKINHFSTRLMRANVFVPTAEIYAKSALGTLGLIDDTTGYWPHRLQYLLILLAPSWVRLWIGGFMYKSMRNTYLKSVSAGERT